MDEAQPPTKLLHEVEVCVPTHPIPTCRARSFLASNLSCLCRQASAMSSLCRTNAAFSAIAWPTSSSALRRAGSASLPSASPTGWPRDGGGGWGAGALLCVVAGIALLVQILQIFSYRTVSLSLPPPPYTPPFPRLHQAQHGALHRQGHRQPAHDGGPALPRAHGTSASRHRLQPSRLLRCRGC